MKLDFDLYPATSTPVLSTTSSPEATVTVTSAPSNSSVHAIPDASPTAAPQRTNGSQLGMGVGLGAGLGCLVIASAIVGRTLYRRGTSQRQKVHGADMSEHGTDHAQADFATENVQGHQWVAEAPAPTATEIGESRGAVPELSVASFPPELNNSTLR